MGYRRLSRAITTHKTAHPADTFTLNWHVFYLNPQAPPYPGTDKREYYNAKFGPDGAAAIFSRLAAAGEGEGIAFKFGGTTGNTRESHQLLWYAGQKEKESETSAGSGGIGGVQTRVIEQLFRAYFEEEKSITDREVLLDAGAAVGFDRGEVEKVLESENGANDVDLEAERARRQLVTGVPHFTVQGRYIVGGAEEPEIFLDIFDRVKRGD